MLFVRVGALSIMDQGDFVVVLATGMILYDGWATCYHILQKLDVNKSSYASYRYYLWKSPCSNDHIDRVHFDFDCAVSHAWKIQNNKRNGAKWKYASLNEKFTRLKMSMRLVLTITKGGPRSNNIYCTTL